MPAATGFTSPERKYVGRLAVPALSIVLIVSVFLGLQNEQMSDMASHSGVWSGPSAECVEWDKVVGESTGAFVFSNMDTNDAGDAFLVDVVPYNVSEGATGGMNYRLRKMGTSGAHVFNTLLYAQPAGERWRASLPPNHLASGQTVQQQVLDTPRMYTWTAVHDPSEAVVVVQSGVMNMSGPTQGADEQVTQFSAVAVYSADDGGCTWGVSFTAPAAEGGAVLTGCDVSEGALDTGFLVTAADMSSVVHAADGGSPYYSWLALLGRTGSTVELNLYRLNFPPDASSPPSPHAHWSAPVAVLPGNGTWASESALPLVDVDIVEFAPRGATAPQPDHAVIVASFPVMPLSPWPSADTFATSGFAGGMLTDVVAYNATSGAQLWRLSTAPTTANAFVAVLSNVVSAPSGIVHFVAARNASAGSVDGRVHGEPPPLEVVAVALDAATAAIVWQTVLAPMSADVLTAGNTVQLVTLALSASGFVFCATPPAFNVTSGVNGSAPTAVATVSVFGLGAVDAVSGDLVRNEGGGGGGGRVAHARAHKHSPPRLPPMICSCGTTRKARCTRCPPAAGG